MTAIIAWRTSDGIEVASDSRLSLPGQAPIDVGAKILRVDCRLEPPAGGAADGSKLPTYELRLGFAFAGSGLAALTLGSALDELLRVVNYVPPFITPHLDTVANTVEKFFHYVRGAFTRSLFQDGELTFLMFGICPHGGDAKPYEFSVRLVDGALSTTHRGVDGSEWPVVLGSGASSLRARLSPGVNLLHALKEVILDPAVPSVGGAVQYAKLSVSRGGFALYKVRDYVVDDVAREVRVGFTFRGLPFLEEGGRYFGEGVFIPASIADPFGVEIDRLTRSGYDLLPLGEPGL